MKRYDIDFGCYEESSHPQAYEDAVTDFPDGDWLSVNECKEDIQALCKCIMAGYSESSTIYQKAYKIYTSLDN